ncbi:MAG: tetratricopeptide repeat protein [Gammaproteobacteria bacterium]|nr:tetratricopeptide repeat protein [Gammaproteobacteria bacterium]
MVNGFKIILPPGAATAIPAVALFLTTLALGPADAQQAIDKFPPDSLAALISAADQGDAADQVSLGDIYRDLAGNPWDPAEAVLWYLAAAEQGYAPAQVRLGDMYLSGLGVPQDYVEAVRWIRAAAEQGYAPAHLHLARLYASGDGVPENDDVAVRWYHAAAEHGHADAQSHLGFMYANGEGVPENDVLAYAWINLADPQGVEEAQEAKDQLSRRMTRERVARAQELSSIERLRDINQPPYAVSLRAAPRRHKAERLQSSARVLLFRDYQEYLTG